MLHHREWSSPEGVVSGILATMLINRDRLGVRILAALVFFCAMFACPIVAHTAPPVENPAASKNVLLLYSYGHGSQGVGIFDDGLLSRNKTRDPGFLRRGSHRIDDKAQGGGTALEGSHTSLMLLLFVALLTLIYEVFTARHHEIHHACQLVCHCRVGTGQLSMRAHIRR